MESKRKSRLGNRFTIGLIGAVLLLRGCMPPASKPPPVLFIADAVGGKILTFDSADKPPA
jgi:hypothetical protein